MKHVSITVALLALISVSTSLIYIASLRCLLGMRKESDYLKATLNGSYPTRESTQELQLTNDQDRIALNFTNDFFHILSDKEWAYYKSDIYQQSADSAAKYVASMYQQLHCLNVVRLAYLSLHVIDRPKLSPALYKEAEMCLEQLRQTVMCSADLTLEPTQLVMDRDGTVTPGSSGLGVLHRCRNWRKLEAVSIGAE